MKNKTSTKTLIESKPKRTSEICSTNTSYKEFHKGYKTIFKPQRGECKGMRDSLSKVPYYKREVLSYELDQLFGFGLVPLTVVAERKIGESGKDIGSRQLWMEGEEGCKSNVEQLMKKTIFKKQFFKMFIFDVICGNTDRHGGNYLVDKKKKAVYAIDNALSFPLEDGLDEFKCEPMDAYNDDMWSEVRGENFSVLKPVLDKKIVSSLKKIKKAVFLALFKKFGLFREGKEAWERMQAIISCKPSPQ